MRLCGCGCGQPTNVATQTYGHRGIKKGDYFQFLAGHSSRLKGTTGYPTAGGRANRQRIHRLRAEAALGKPLPPKAHVHHADGSKRADAPLVICEDAAYHHLLHIRTKILRLGGDPNTQRCCYACHQLKPIEAFGKRSRTSDGRDGTCRDCCHLRQPTYDKQRRFPDKRRKLQAEYSRRWKEKHQVVNG